MAFDGNFMCTSFKVELLKGIHDFTASSGDTFKIALYTNSAAFRANTTAYTTANEVSNSGTYSAGGGILVSATPVASGVVAVCDFADISFTEATITAYGALIYNSSASGNPAVAVLDFTSAKTSTTGTFTISFPAPGSSSAIVRIA